MKSYLAEIDDILEGETPRQKYEWLNNLIQENARAKGRIDFCKNQFEYIVDDPETNQYTRKWIKSVLETLATPI